MPQLSLQSITQLQPLMKLSQSKGSDTALIQSKQEKKINKKLFNQDDILCMATKSMHLKEVKNLRCDVAADDEKSHCLRRPSSVLSFLCPRALTFLTIRLAILPWLCRSRLWEKTRLLSFMSPDMLASPTEQEKETKSCRQRKSFPLLSYPEKKGAVPEERCLTLRETF